MTDLCAADAMVGRRRADWPLLQVAQAFETATGHSQVIPPVLR